MIGKLSYRRERLNNQRGTKVPRNFFEKTFQKVLTILSVCAIIRPWKGDNPFRRKKGDTNMEKRWEVWYKEHQFDTNHLWGVYDNEEEADWAVINAKGQGYNPTKWAFEK